MLLTRSPVHFTIAEPGGIITNYATSSMSQLGTHPAYDAPDSPARVLATYVDDPESRKSWSRPEDVARAIYEVVSCGKPVPMRFPLGMVSWQMLRAEADNLAKEFDEMKDLSCSVGNQEREDYVEVVKSFAST